MWFAVMSEESRAVMVTIVAETWVGSRSQTKIAKLAGRERVLSRAITISPGTVKRNICKDLDVKATCG